MRRALVVLLMVAVPVGGAVLPAGTAGAAAAYSGPCHAAVDAYWPANLRPWAHRIVQRESRGIPTAANRRSSARGCFQMLLRYSAPFYKAVGCSNAQWSNATCNVRAALVMRTRHGARPWAL
jgi:hypothetical protein